MEENVETARRSYNIPPVMPFPLDFLRPFNSYADQSINRRNRVGGIYDPSYSNNPGDIESSGGDLRRFGDIFNPSYIKPADLVSYRSSNGLNQNTLKDNYPNDAKIDYKNDKLKQNYNDVNGVIDPSLLPNYGKHDFVDVNGVLDPSLNPNYVKHDIIGVLDRKKANTESSQTSKGTPQTTEPNQLDVPQEVPNLGSSRRSQYANHLQQSDNSYNSLLWPFFNPLNSQSQDDYDDEQILVDENKVI